MKMLRVLSAAAFAAALMFSLAQAEDAKKDAKAAAPQKPACCLKAEKEGKKCDKPCCVAAAKEGKVCQKCLDADKAAKAEKKAKKKAEKEAEKKDK